MTDRPNVLLLIFDTLRADALTCYDGAFQIETADLDRAELREDTILVPTSDHGDLFATLCNLAGLDAPDTEGHPLFGDSRRDAVFAAEAPSNLDDREAVDEVSAATHREFEVGRKSVRTEGYRFELRSDGSEILYELPDESTVSDPDESVVADLRNRIVETLGSEFDAAADGSDSEYGAAVERNLRELGYLE